MLNLRCDGAESFRFSNDCIEKHALVSSRRECCFFKNSVDNQSILRLRHDYSESILFYETCIEIYQF